MRSHTNKSNNLLVCDRIKSQLSEGALRHILSLESKVKGNWLPQLTESLDLFYDSHVNGDKPRYVNNAVSNSGPIARFNNNVRTPPIRPPPPTGGYRPQSTSNVNRNSVGSTRRCFVCNSPNHLQNYHSRVGSRVNGQSVNNNKPEFAGKRASVNAMCTVNDVVSDQGPASLYEVNSASAPAPGLFNSLPVISPSQLSNVHLSLIHI